MLDGDAISVRLEKPADHAAVYEVHRRAFGRPNEADLVEVLRRFAHPRISMVALRDDRVAGHIFFSPVSIQPAGVRALGLGPMAVALELQSRGIGSRLVEAGLAACRGAGYPVVVVLGGPRFYRRFGFESARPKGLQYEHPVPEEMFMVVELEPGALHGCAGVVKYLPDFANV